MSSPVPWYAHEDQGTQAHKRLLLLTYHFPPDTAIGARRWEKLALYAAERGWGMDVVTRELPERPNDLVRLNALPSGVRIYRIPVAPIVAQQIEASIYSLLSRIRSAVNVQQMSRNEQSNGEHTQTSSLNSASQTPQVVLREQHKRSRPSSFNREEIRWSWTPRSLLRSYWATVEYAQYFPWIRQASQLSARIGSPKTHLAIVSSGPPHMMHEAARRASVMTGIPLVMDMRDPWSQNEQIVESIASPVWYEFANHYERRAIDRAMLVVANTELARQALWSAYPEKRSDIITVMNGADEDPLPPSRSHGRFVIAHAGTLYLDRDPRALFEASARVIRDLKLTPEQFGLEFIGAFDSVGGYPIQEVVRQIGIEPYVRIGPLLPHAQAMEFMANATMLVTMSGSNVTAIPAKTFECVRFNAWLLALSSPGSATSLLLRGTGADVAAPNDTDAIATAITRRVQEHQAGISPPRLGDDPRFSRRQQATHLLDSIEIRRNK